MLYTVRKLSAPGSQKSSHFCVTKGHNKIDILHLGWRVIVTSEQMIINSFFWVLDVIWDTIHCHKENVPQYRNARIFLHIFQQIVYSKIAWEVAMMVSGQFKTTKRYLWHIQCIPLTFSMALLWHFLLFTSSYFKQKTMRLVVKNVKTEVFGCLIMEHMRN